ncbi:hypothetical protein A33M_2934 [Rhodovulum sp. PH10]|nr:hypothetical protein A33M_2934 [Rhodovulum sp. PH10]
MRSVSPTPGRGQGGADAAVQRSDAGDRRDGGRTGRGSRDGAVTQASAGRRASVRDSDGPLGAPPLRSRLHRARLVGTARTAPISGLPVFGTKTHGFARIGHVSVRNSGRPRLEWVAGRRPTTVRVPNGL